MTPAVMAIPSGVSRPMSIAICAWLFFECRDERELLALLLEAPLGTCKTSPPSSEYESWWFDLSLCLRLKNDLPPEDCRDLLSEAEDVDGILLFLHPSVTQTSCQ